MFDKILEDLEKSSKVNSSICIEEGYHFIECSGVLSTGIAESSENPHNKMVVRALVSEQVESLRDLSHGLKKAFEEMVFNRFAARSLGFYNQACLLRFVTSAQDKKYTTGIIIIGGKHYEELVRRRSKMDRPTLKDCEDIFDFSDLENPESEEEQANSLIVRNWQDDKPFIEEILTLLQNIEEIECLTAEEFSRSRIHQDSVLFNIQYILRTINRVSSGYDDLREIRNEIARTFYSRGEACRNKPKELWNNLKVLSKLKRLLREIVIKNETKTN